MTALDSADFTSSVVQRETNFKGRTTARAVGCPRLPTVREGDCLHHREPQPGHMPDPRPEPVAVGLLDGHRHGFAEDDVLTGRRRLHGAGGNLRHRRGDVDDVDVVPVDGVKDWAKYRVTGRKWGRARLTLSYADGTRQASRIWACAAGSISSPQVR